MPVAPIVSRLGTLLAGKTLAVGAPYAVGEALPHRREPGAKYTRGFGESIAAPVPNTTPLGAAALGAGSTAAAEALMGRLGHPTRFLGRTPLRRAGVAGLLGAASFGGFQLAAQARRNRRIGQGKPVYGHDTGDAAARTPRQAQRRRRRTGVALGATAGAIGGIATASRGTRRSATFSAGPQIRDIRRRARTHARQTGDPSRMQAARAAEPSLRGAARKIRRPAQRRLARRAGVGALLGGAGIMAWNRLTRRPEQRQRRFNSEDSQRRDPKGRFASGGGGGKGRKVAKKLGRAAKKAGEQIGHAAHEAGEQIGRTAKQAAQAAKRNIIDPAVEVAPELAAKAGRTGVNAVTFGVRNRLTFGSLLRRKGDSSLGATLGRRVLSELVTVPVEVLKGAAAGGGGAILLHELQKQQQEKLKQQRIRTRKMRRGGNTHDAPDDKGFRRNPNRRAGDPAPLFGRAVREQPAPVRRGVPGADPNYQPPDGRTTERQRLAAQRGEEIRRAAARRAQEREAAQRAQMIAEHNAELRRIRGIGQNRPGITMPPPPVSTRVPGGPPTRTEPRRPRARRGAGTQEEIAQVARQWERQSRRKQQRRQRTPIRPAGGSRVEPMGRPRGRTLQVLTRTFPRTTALVGAAGLGLTALGGVLAHRSAQRAQGKQHRRLNSPVIDPTAKTVDQVLMEYKRRTGGRRHGTAGDIGTPMGGYATGRRRAADARIEPGSPEHRRAVARERARTPGGGGGVYELPPRRPGRPGFLSRLGETLRKVGHVAVNEGPRIPVSMPLPGGARMGGTVRLTPAGGLGIAAAYGTYRHIRAQQRKKKQQGGATADADFEQVFGPGGQGRVQRGSPPGSRGKPPRVVTKTKLRPGIPSLLALGAGGGMVLSGALRNRKRRRRAEPANAGGAYPPTTPAVSGRGGSIPVALDPETLHRLRSLHGHAGSRELREYGQSLGGIA